ncbi:MAG: hypothetical protein ACRDQ0_19890 [Pseudonocardia sp.]
MTIRTPLIVAALTAALLIGGAGLANATGSAPAGHHHSSSVPTGHHHND